MNQAHQSINPSINSACAGGWGADCIGPWSSSHDIAHFVQRLQFVQRLRRCSARVQRAASTALIYGTRVIHGHNNPVHSALHTYFKYSPRQLSMDPARQLSLGSPTPRLWQIVGRNQGGRETDVDALMTTGELGIAFRAGTGGACVQQRRAPGVWHQALATGSPGRFGLAHCTEGEG